MTFHRVLVTGACGLLGQELVRHLGQQSSFDVLATGRDAAPPYDAGSVGYTRMDITDFARVRQVMEDFTPHSVVNCAAMARVDGCETNREECWSINVEAVENLVRCCRQHGSKLVQISTDFIFDGEDGPYDEGARPNPVNFYGKSKLAAENALRQLSPDKWTIIRTVLVYGTGVGLKRSNIGMWIIEELANGRPIRVFSDQLRSPTYVDDLAAGIGRVLRFERTGVFNISGREFMSIYDFAVEMARAFGFDASLVSPVTCDEMELTAPRPPKTGFIILKAETELGYKPHSLSKALEALRLKINPPVSHTS